MIPQDAESCSTAPELPPEKPNVRKKPRPSARYQKVLDGRKQPIRRLWIRNGRFLARITAENASGRKEVKWVPLPGADSVAQAQNELRRLLTKRDHNELPALKRAPKFRDYVARYLEHHANVKDTKRPGTLNRERSCLKGWVEHLNETRLDKITKAQINAFREKRKADGLSGRTVNIDVIVLRNVLNKGIDDGWLKSLPTENMRPLKWTAPKRDLVPFEDIQRLCDGVFNPLFFEGHVVSERENGKPLKNAQQFSDYVTLMALCGSRRDETLRIRWKDVDFGGKQLTIGSDGLAKNGEFRTVDFNDELAAHLKEMHSRRAPDSEYLFPSPQRGAADAPAKTFKESLALAKQAAKMPTFGFHDCRHSFISKCVMAGIDFMTIAAWVGHKDGGVLIGKVYGHLANEHRKQMAQRVVFMPRVADGVPETAEQL